MTMVSQVFGSIENTEQWERLVQGLESCKFYCYIIHDRDVYDDDDVKRFHDKDLPITFDIGQPKEHHLHFVAEDKRISLSTWAERLGIPQNMICITKKELGGQRVAVRYLLHLDHPRKFPYDKGLVTTNKPIKFESYLSDNIELSPLDLCEDMRKLRERKISRSDFLLKYKFYLSKQSFYSQYRIYQDLLKWSDD